MTESGGKIQTKNKAEIYVSQVTLSVLSKKIRLITDKPATLIADLADSLLLGLVF